MTWQKNAEAKLDPKVASNYQTIQRMVHDRAEQAYTMAMDLPKFQYADDMRLALLATTAHHAGRVDEAIKWYSAYAKAAKRPMDQYRAQLLSAELLVLIGEVNRAKGILQELDKKRSQLKGRFTEQRQLSARVLRMRHDLAKVGDPAAARGFARNLLMYLPAEPETTRPGLVLGHDDLNEAQKMQRGRSLYHAWSYHEARKVFLPFQNHKKYGDSARWHLAQIALNKLRDDFPKAEKLFGTLLGNSSYAAESLFQLARAKMRQERYAEAIADLDRYRKRFPKGDRVELVYYYRGWLPYDHRKNKKAIRELNIYIDKYGRRGRKSTYMYGFRAWAYMRLGQWQEAIKAWDAMLPFGNPLVAGKAMYWKSYAYMKLGQKDRALATIDALRKRWPVSYYGMHAEQLRAKMLGKDQRASKLWWPAKSGSFNFAPRVSIDDLPINRLSLSNQKQWRRVEELVQLGEKRDARRTLSPIYQTVLRLTPTQKRDEWIHALGVYVDDYNKMWRVGSKGTISYLPMLPPRNGLHNVMAYPQAYSDVVHKVAKEFELPPYIIWSIMRQESRYKPSAISHTDAVGALQMIPKTARKVALDLGITYNPRTFHFPEVGFRYSAYYMKKLLNTFGGLFVPMAGAYNSGPKTIARWFRKNPNVPLAWLIEEFEYNEGRAYSRKVGEHLLRYIYLYEKDETKRAKLLDAMFPLSRDINLPDDVGY